MSTAHWYLDCCRAAPVETTGDEEDPNRPVLLRAGADAADPNAGVLVGKEAIPQLAKLVLAAAEDGCKRQRKPVE